MPRVHIERDAKLPGRLVFRLGGEIVGTLDVSGAGSQLENLQLRDFTQTHEDIDVLDIEVRHPREAKLSWDLWRHGIKKTKDRYGIGDVKLRLVELKPPYNQDPEIQLWPPLGYDLPAIDRPESLSDEEHARLAEERRVWREEGEKLSKSLKQLHSRLDSSYSDYEDAQSDSAVAVVSELLGDARYPMPDEWNQVSRTVFDAEVAFDHSDRGGSKRLMKKAERELAAINEKVAQFKRDRENGAARAVKVLRPVAAIGEQVAHMIPGPIGAGLSLAYEVVKGPPQSLEEAADRMAGAAGIGHQAGSPHMPNAPQRPTNPNEPTPTRPTEPTKPPQEPPPAATKPPQEPPAPTPAKPPPDDPPPTPRRQQQQQHQPVGVRVREPEGQPQRSTHNEQQGQRQQQQQQQQTKVGPMRTEDIAKRGYPLGFQSRGQFTQFGQAARGVLNRAGYNDAEVGMQGSAATGFRESDGSPFDSGRASDFDVAIVSPTLFAEAQSQGIQVRASGAVPHAADHTTFALTPDQAAALGVGDLALPKTWSPSGGRPVNVMVFASRAAAIAKQPHTIWAR